MLHNDAVSAMKVAVKRLRLTHEDLCNKAIFAPSSSTTTTTAAGSGGDGVGIPDVEQYNNSNIKKSPKENDSDDSPAVELTKLAENTKPEIILSYVLYLLSYHPNFPSSAGIESENDKKGTKEIIRSVKFIVDTLMLSTRNASTDLCYLFKQVNTISHFYQDTNDHANIGLHFVVRLAMKLLTIEIRSDESSDTFPGLID
jgi:hypothetical protein